MGSNMKDLGFEFFLALGLWGLAFGLLFLGFELATVLAALTFAIGLFFYFRWFFGWYY